MCLDSSQLNSLLSFKVTRLSDVNSIILWLSTYKLRKVP